MATLVLAAAGTAAGSAVGGAFLGVSAEILGGFAGSLIGGQIDNALFGPDRTVTGPRLEDLSVQSSAYGTPVPVPFGTTRISGNIIWSAGLKETRHEDQTSAGGKGGGQTVTQVSFTYSASFAVALAARPISGVARIWADGKLLRDAGGQMAVGGQLRVYKGDERQQPDPLIEAVEGLGNISAHRGLAYVVFEDLQLAEYANRIPNLTFEVIADAGGTASLGTVVTDLAARAGLDAVDTTDLDSVVEGFVLARPNAARDAIEALARVYNIDVAEVDGQLIFEKRPKTAVATIEEERLGAQPFDDRLEPRLMTRRRQELDLPREVLVRHIDPDRDYQMGTQRARKVVTGARRLEVIDVPAVLTASAAKQAAEVQLSRAWSARENFQLSLMPGQGTLVPGDVVTVTAAGAQYTLRLDKITFAGLLACEATAESESIYNSGATGQGGAFPGQAVLDPGPTTLELMNLPSLTAADPFTPVYYAAAAGAADGWRGTTVFMSKDGEISYGELASMIVPATMGATTTVLDAGPTTFWDEGNTLNVQLLRDDMTLESRDPLTVLSGQNAALVGDEIIQFREAVLESDGSYTLTGLLRGRRGTEWATTGHAVGERFVALNPGSVAAIETALGSLDITYHYKPVSTNNTLAETATQTFAYSGADLRPFSPVHPKGQRNESGDLTITWLRRTRVGGEWRDGADVPLSEESEHYEIDILDGGVVVRTLTTSSPQAVYTADEQIADFGVAQTAVDLKIYQMSSAVGRGIPLKVTL